MILSTYHIPYDYYADTTFQTLVMWIKRYKNNISNYDKYDAAKPANKIVTSLIRILRPKFSSNSLSKSKLKEAVQMQEFIYLYLMINSAIS